MWEWNPAIPIPGDIIKKYQEHQIRKIQREQEVQNQQMQSYQEGKSTLIRKSNESSSIFDTVRYSTNQLQGTVNSLSSTNATNQQDQSLLNTDNSKMNFFFPSRLAQKFFSFPSPFKRNNNNLNNQGQQQQLHPAYYNQQQQQQFNYQQSQLHQQYPPSQLQQFNFPSSSYPSQIPQQQYNQQQYNPLNQYQNQYNQNEVVLQENEHKNMNINIASQLNSIESAATQAMLNQNNQQNMFKFQQQNINNVNKGYTQTQQQQPSLFSNAQFHDQDKNQKQKQQFFTLPAIFSPKSNDEQNKRIKELNEQQTRQKRPLVPFNGRPSQQVQIQQLQDLINLGEQKFAHKGTHVKQGHTHVREQPNDGDGHRSRKNK